MFKTNLADPKVHGQLIDNNIVCPMKILFLCFLSLSGGIERDWEGLPRRYFIPGTKDWRCACVNEPLLDDPHVKLYPGCSPEEKKCKIDKQKLKEEL